MSDGNYIDLTKKTNGVLNLSKNDILDLTKAVPTLNNIRVAAGWDVNTGFFGGTFDLDLCAILVDGNNRLISGENPCVYYGKKKSKGIYLDGDNLTGEGDGDDENIYVTLSEIPSQVKRIIFNVVIYNGLSKKQKFAKVKNAYVRIVNTANRDEEICRYNLSNDGGDNTAVVFAELIRNGSNWEFKAIGEYKQASIEQLLKNY